MSNPLHRFFWEESEVRGWAYALIAIVGILYASVRSLLFHLPEWQIAVELFVLLLGLNCIAVVITYLRARESLPLKKTDIVTLSGRGYLQSAILILILVASGTLFTFDYVQSPFKPYVQILGVVLTFITLLLSIFVSGLMTFPVKESAIREQAPLPSAYIRYGGLVACLILIIAPRLSLSRVQAAIVNQRLERAALSIEPDRAPGLSSNQLKTALQQIASIASTSTQYKISANPHLVEKVKNNLEETLKSVNPTRDDVRRTGLAAFVGLVAYARANNVLIAVNAPTILLPHGETGISMVSQVPLKNGAVWWQGSAQGSTIVALPQPSSEPVFPISHSSIVFNAVNFNGFGSGRSFVGTDNESQVVVINAIIEGAAQRLDGIVWLNIKFKNSRIIYNGGPLYLGDVSFENCQFEFGIDPQSQNALAQIKEIGKQPMTLASGL